ncbi:hypothetical protein ACLOJK_013863 [Asimina triloba]
MDLLTSISNVELKKFKSIAILLNSQQSAPATTSYRLRNECSVGEESVTELRDPDLRTPRSTKTEVSSLVYELDVPRNPC